jgi:hypothetical protein
MTYIYPNIYFNLSAMKTSITCIVALLIMINLSCSKKETNTNDWVSLFDGKTLEGWKASERPTTFAVSDGMIAVNGDRAHLFYVGPVMDHNFKNFEFKASVMTKPGSNSGMYFHTAYQEEGWPSKGYEVQVNNTHTDWRKTGSIYAIQDVKDSLVRDDEWFTQHIIVQGRKITVKLNDKVINEYTDPESDSSRLSSGTFALQGHDPDSKVFYKDIMVRPLDE